MAKARYICTKCGATMWAPTKISGMGCWVTILLLIAFVATVVTFLWVVSFLILVLDAIIYYCTLKKNCCPKCKGAECVIPLDTPMGRRLLQDFNAGSQSTSSGTAEPAQSEPADKGKVVYDPNTHEYVRK
ncbi:MAG: hypothetical protein IKO72_02490 [Kiritimatiellae bacterium]|nr:hypothetical protein [Kiritimatiellia bacterium]